MTISPTDTLSKYGSSFQIKCVVALLTDRQFAEQMSDVVKSAFFENEGNKWAVEKILWYFQTYRSLPSMDVFKTEIEKIPYDVLKTSAIAQLREIYRTENQHADDLSYVKTEFLTFCKNQAIKAAILKSVDHLQSGDYDRIKIDVDAAMNAGSERNLGHVYLNDMDARWSKLARNCVPTPWACINEIMDGGLGAGELGCIVANSGGGKSWMLTAMGAHAIAMGKKVAHYTLELSETYLGLRYDTVFTGIEPNKVSSYQSKVMSAMAGIQGQLFIKYFPARAITVNTIRAHLQRLQILGHAPDLVLIDYADLMMSVTKTSARHEELQFLHEEIRGMLGELRIPGWTASQAGRSSLQDDVVEADRIAGSYGKIMTDDVVISTQRKMADKITNTARVHVIKNRFGPDGMTFPAEMDLTHGRINIWDESSAQGTLLKNKMASGEGAIKALLARKLMHPAKLPDPTTGP